MMMMPVPIVRTSTLPTIPMFPATSMVIILFGIALPLVLVVVVISRRCHLGIVMTRTPAMMSALMARPTREVIEIFVLRLQVYRRAWCRVGNLWQWLVHNWWREQERPVVDCFGVPAYVLAYTFTSWPSPDISRIADHLLIGIGLRSENRLPAGYPSTPSSGPPRIMTLSVYTGTLFCKIGRTSILVTPGAG
jgi:hypothetical protein